MKKKSLNAKKKIHKKLLNYLKNPLISKIFRDFENFLLNYNDTKSFAVAVSGGPDSLALTYLSKCFSILNDVNVKYYHVDHKLRYESTEEAKKIGLLLKGFDINCKTIVWKGQKPKSNIQSVSRNKRYSLIINQIIKENINHILVAHQLDDLYENFLIRLFRGSGLKGLSSFSESNSESSKGVIILRPLIKYNKKTLLYITNKIFNYYINDPSNSNENFKRTRIRKLINNLKQEGLDENKLKLTISNLSDSNSAIEHFVRENINLNSSYSKSNLTYIIRANFFAQPHEVIFRSLSNILKKVGKKYYSSRGKSLNQMIKRIKSKKFNKATISGCIIEKISNSLIIYKENRKKSQN